MIKSTNTEMQTSLTCRDAQPRIRVIRTPMIPNGSKLQNCLHEDNNWSRSPTIDRPPSETQSFPSPSAGIDAGITKLQIPGRSPYFYVL